jgi:hypothetical protein
MTPTELQAMVDKIVVAYRSNPENTRLNPAELSDLAGIIRDALLDAEAEAAAADIDPETWYFGRGAPQEFLAHQGHVHPNPGALRRDRELRLLLPFMCAASCSKKSSAAQRRSQDQ